jgi:hypothetical protein
MFFAKNLNLSDRILTKFIESFHHILAAIVGVDMIRLKKLDELNPLYFRLFLLLPCDSEGDLTMDFVLCILGMLGATTSTIAKIDLKKVKIMKKTASEFFLTHHYFMRLALLLCSSTGGNGWTPAPSFIR